MPDSGWLSSCAIEAVSCPIVSTPQAIEQREWRTVEFHEQRHTLGIASAEVAGYLAALSGKVVLVPPLELGSWRQRLLVGFRAADQVTAPRESDEDEDEDDEGAAGSLPPDQQINQSFPTLRLFVSANPDRQRYCYSLFDYHQKLSHSCVRILPHADATGLALMAVVNGLKSIQKTAITAALVETYGFRSKSAALASDRKLTAELVITDSDLAQLGTVVTENSDALDFMKLVDRHVWQSVLAQTSRFDVTWTSIIPNDPFVRALEAWADRALNRATHDGPIQSPARRFGLSLDNHATEAA